MTLKDITASIVRISLFGLFCLDSSAQQVAPFELSKIIPPSPTAASLGNFGNNSVGAYNGVPEISIPLFQANVNNQNINIALSYDASGTKAAQDASWVGLGWSLLNGGGVITRTVRGRDDLYSGGYHFIEALPTQGHLDSFYNAPYVTDAALMNYLFSMRSGQIDGEPDLFSYNFGGNNGKFVFDKTINGSSIVQLECSNLKFSYLNPGWKAIDGNGNSYYFNTLESAEDYSLTTEYEIGFDASVYDLTDENLERHNIVNAWYLDSIVSATSQKITFTYSVEVSMSLLSKSEQKYNRIQHYLGPFPPAQVNIHVASRQLLSNRLPDKIIFDNGSIEFHTGNRIDIRTTSGYTGAKYLSDIVQKNSDGDVIKKFNFYYSYFNDDDYTGTNKRLKLDSVKEISGTGLSHPPYKFSYFNPNELPAKYTKAIDHWGYFNGKINNTTLIPAKFMHEPFQWTLNFPGANRLPDTALNSVQNGVLSSIMYPTGGSTDFTYELNEYINLHYGDDKYDNKDTTRALAFTWDGQPDKLDTFVLNETREVNFFFDYHYRNNPEYRNEFIDDYAFLYSNAWYNGQQPYMVFRNYQPYPEPHEINTQSLMLMPGTYRMRLVNISGANNWKIHAN